MAEPWCEDCLAGCFVGACACPRTFWAGEGFCSSPTTSAAAEDLLPGRRGGRALVRGLRGWLRHRGLRCRITFWAGEGLCSAPVHTGPRLSAFGGNPTTSAAAGPDKLFNNEPLRLCVRRACVRASQTWTCGPEFVSFSLWHVRTSVAVILYEQT